MSSLAERYCAGDRSGVWDELHARGSLADAGDALRNDARVDSEPGDDSGIWFVDYLRRYFTRGGFRRLRPDHVYPAACWPGLAEGLLDL